MSVGFPKTGTSWLFQMLREHPDAYLPMPPWVINEEGGKEFNLWSLWIRNLFHSDDRASVEAYRDVFSKNNGLLRGEVSTNYSFDPNCLLYLRKLSPDIKFIIGIRNPIDVLISAYGHNKRSGAKISSFKKWTNDHTTRDQILSQINYDKSIKVCLEKNADATYIYQYENLSKNTASELKNIFDFLNIRSDVDIASITKRYNSKYIYRFRKFHMLNLTILTNLYGFSNGRKMFGNPHLRTLFARFILTLNESCVNSYPIDMTRKEIANIVRPYTEETAQKFNLSREWFG